VKRLSTIYLLNDGKICIGFDSGEIRVWDLSSGTCVLGITGHLVAIRNLLQLDDKQICSSACNEKSFKVWDLSTGLCLHTLETEDSIWRLANVSGRARLYSISQSNTISIYDTNTWECLRTADTGFDIYDVLVLMSGHLFGISRPPLNAESSRMKIWDTASLDCIRSIGFNSILRSFIEVYYGVMAMSLENMSIEVWDIDEGMLLRSVPTIYIGRIYSFSKLRDGRLLAVGRHKLTIWNIDTWQCEQNVDTTGEGEGTFTRAFLERMMAV
jgi:WD40 repeat protein